MFFSQQASHQNVFSSFSFIQKSINIVHFQFMFDAKWEVGLLVAASVPRAVVTHLEK
uniref:Uncharacterized protein n=1 Tax=Meloidogyne incognita TaxID=6306 RepID=A0A914KLE6_MELIC